jgi:Fis family transcriptional regulator, factor for inversion stimulation protein
VTVAEAVTDSLDLYDRAAHGTEPCDLYALVMGEAEKAVLQWTMVSVGHNQSRAAEWLGLSRATLRNRLSLYGIVRPSDASVP